MTTKKENLQISRDYVSAFQLFSRIFSSVQEGMQRLFCVGPANISSSLLTSGKERTNNTKQHRAQCLFCHDPVAQGSSVETPLNDIF